MTETLVERRRRLLRDELREVAVDLFCERGFDAVTVDDIAVAAGMSQRTFFRYFASKDNIVLELAQRLDERLIAALDARPTSEGAVTALREAYRTTSHVEPDQHDRVLQLGRLLTETPVLRARADGEHLHHDRELLDRVAHRMGVEVSDRAVRVLVSAMAAVAAAEFHAWVDAGGHGNPSDAIAEALTVLEHGLGTR